MGDRGNIGFVQDNGTDIVFLYTHWSGSDIGNTLRRALAKKWRWNDVTYLARIVFCEMVKGCENEEYGFGISANMLCDNEHIILIVDCNKQTIFAVEEDNWSQYADRHIQLWTFEEFIEPGVKDKDIEDILKE